VDRELVQFAVGHYSSRGFTNLGISSTPVTDPRAAGVGKRGSVFCLGQR
jgi:hypothetical protein